MKNVYLCQFNDTTPGESSGYYYFPYSVSLLWSYATTFPEITREYKLGEFFFIKEPFENIINKLIEPEIFCLSSYVWNESYNIELARQVKLKYPNCKIIYGGPSTSSCTTSWLVEHPWIDHVVYGEGEIAFTGIIKCYIDGSDFSKVPSISYGVGDGRYRTKAQPRIADLDIIPSPYLIGLFDDIVEHYRDDPTVILNAITESNRGCPYACTFCDWGGVSFSKIKKRDMEIVKQEILWSAKNGIELFQLADANFMIFKRDKEIIDFITECKQKYGFPKLLDVGGWSKNQTADNVDIAKELLDNRLLRKFTVSIQTNNQDSLLATKRTNSPHYDAIMARADELGVPVNLDIIMGNPLDTYDNMVNLISNLFEKNRTMAISPFMILTGSEASHKSYQDEYSIEVKTVKSRNSYLVDEYQTFIIETSTMNKQEYQKLLMYVWFSLMFDSTGYMHIIRQSANKSGISTVDFYEQLMEFIASEGCLTEHYYQKLADSKEFRFDKFEGYPHGEVIIDIIENNIDQFYIEIEKFCSSIGMSHIDDCIKLQRYMKSRPTEDQLITFSSNIYDYLVNNLELVTEQTTYKFDYSYARDWYNSNRTHFKFWLSTRANRLWESTVTRV